MNQISSSIEIAAPIERVWAILTDGPRYPKWNPFITSLEGDVREGERLRVRLVPPGRKGMTFRPEVLVVEAPRRFTWLGRLVLP